MKNNNEMSKSDIEKYKNLLKHLMIIISSYKKILQALQQKYSIICWNSFSEKISRESLLDKF